MGCAIILKKHSFYTRENSREGSRPIIAYLKIKKTKYIIQSYILNVIDEVPPSEESSIKW